MDTPNQPVIVLSRALDQAGDLLATIQYAELGRPTPCGEWTVRELADHLTAAPEHFLQQARGEEVDWTARAEVVDGGWATHFRAEADDLMHHWHSQPADALAQADWQTAEVAVHTWDLVQALGRSVELDEEVAERGLAFVREGLTSENRGDAFGPAVDVPEDAGAYERLAAFAGRDPSSS